MANVALLNAADIHCYILYGSFMCMCE